MTWLRPLFTRRPVRVVTREWPEMSPREIRTALRVDPENPLWRAIHQLIEAQTDACLSETIDADNQRDPAMLHYYNGGAAHLAQLRAFLIDEREQALARMDEDE